MLMLQRVAQKYGMACLLHEKPFAGVNGSGKHLNWSLGTRAMNLLEPGSTPHRNAQFLVFCSAVIRAVDKYGALLRATVAHAGNDHRLGANEAPPAIISIYLGDQLTRIFQHIARGKPGSASAPGYLNVGVDALPPIPKDAGDRNRTSPFAFTGNKFEFRAVGSSQSVAGPLVAINTMMAESLDYIATRLEKETAGASKNLNAAAQKVIRDVVREHGRVIFNGDNYSAEWHREAGKRGLPNLRNSVDALSVMARKDHVDLLSKYKVLSKRELESRQEIYLERYVKEIGIEGRLTLEMARTMVFPAAVSYQQRLAGTAESLKTLGLSHCTTILEEVTRMLSALQPAMSSLEAVLSASEDGSVHDHAKHARDDIIPAMAKVREIVDRLEGFVADELWPLPTYQEMLFIK